MKTMKGLLTLAALAAAWASYAQSPRGTAEGTIEGKKISIDYGRPSLQGRDMLGKAPPGTVWRMGADTATGITTEGDLLFGDVTIPKGSYSLWCKRADEKNWELIFNKQTGQWGTQHDASQDLASVPLKWESQDSSTEQFTIKVSSAEDGGELAIIWGTHVLKTPFKVK
ncbi:MAG: DUF2911 domain-containing protein [Acidobacteriota bacterium]